MTHSSLVAVSRKQEKIMVPPNLLSLQESDGDSAVPVEDNAGDHKIVEAALIEKDPESGIIVDGAAVCNISIDTEDGIDAAMRVTFPSLQRSYAFDATEDQEPMNCSSPSPRSQIGRAHV